MGVSVGWWGRDVGAGMDRDESVMVGMLIGGLLLAIVLMMAGWR